MGRRTLLLIASILVAALGTALVFLYVQGADQRARQGETAVPVIYAALDIPPNTTAAAALAPPDAALGRTMARGAVDALQLDLVTNVNQVNDLVVKSTIPKGAPLQMSMFAKQAAAVSGPISPSKGNLAVSISLGNPQRVSFLTTGMSVAIFITGSSPSETRLLLPKVKVLDIAGTAAISAAGGAPASGAPGQAVPATTVTLDLNQDDAMKIIQTQAGGGGQLWFALLGTDANPTPGSSKSTHDLYTQ